MLEDFKSEILCTFSLQMDTMQIKKKQEEVERELAIFSLDIVRGIPEMSAQ